jgi:transcriptional regulator with XRE-family HTH domain
MTRTLKDTALCRAFGKHLAQLRKDQGWSQERLALESGIARSYIGDVERGIRNISLVNIVRIADTLEMDVRKLFEYRVEEATAINETNPGDGS